MFEILIEILVALGLIEPRPRFRKERYPCPFHGFHAAFGIIFMDQEGSECGLDAEQCTACYMQNYPEGPNWDSCQYNRKDLEETIDLIRRKVRICPKEFNPSNGKSWAGIKMDTFWKHVMGPKFPRPVQIKKETN